MEVRDVLPRDAIPSIDAPRFGADFFGDPDDRVVVVEADPPRAYPLRILSYHEVVNDVLESAALDSQPESRGDSGDVVDGDPIAVTWCPICGSALVFDRALGGRVLTFGVSGKLADDALVLYDRETGSEWRQPSGEALSGPFAGARLHARPAPITTWEGFRADHPSGLVLQPERRDQGPPSEVYDMAPYRRYFEGEAFGLHGMRGQGQPRAWDREDLDPKAVVLGVHHGGAALAFPLPWVEEAGGVVTGRVGGLDVVVFAAAGEPYAYESPGFDFAPTDAGLRADGATWDPVSGESDDGRRLARVPARRLFAFAWQDDHGPDAFFHPD